MQAGSITVMSFLSFSILRKVKDENENVWDDFINGALFVINTKVSSTTKFSPFSIMFGRQPWLPFEVEKFCAADRKWGGNKQAGSWTDIFASLLRQDGYDKKCSVSQGRTQHNHSPGETKKAVPKEERRAKEKL